jgi:predicted nucleic acid-binding Zn ribbon protein
MAMNGEPVPLGAALDRVMRRLRGPRTVHVTTVFDGWPDLVGAGIAAHARPVALRDGELVVEADDPTWASQLRWLEAELLARLHAELGAEAPTRVVVRVAGPAGGRDTTPRSRRPTRRPR